MLATNSSHNQYTWATCPSKAAQGLPPLLSPGYWGCTFLFSKKCPPNGPQLTTAQAELPAAVLLGDGVCQQQHLILKAASLEGQQDEENQWGLTCPETSVNSGYETPPTKICSRGILSGQRDMGDPVLQVLAGT